MLQYTHFVCLPVYTYRLAYIVAAVFHTIGWFSLNSILKRNRARRSFCTHWLPREAVTPRKTSAINAHRHEPVEMRFSVLQFHISEAFGRVEFRAGVAKCRAFPIKFCAVLFGSRTICCRRKHTSFPFRLRAPSGY